MRNGTAGRVATGTLTGTALLLAMGVVLPIVFHAIPLGGRIFLPMHLPTFVAGLVLGPVAGLVVGAGSPVLSGLLTGRPTVFYMIPMVLELATYGFVAGLLRQRLAAIMRGRGAGAVAIDDRPAQAAARAVGRGDAGPGRLDDSREGRLDRGSRVAGPRDRADGPDHSDGRRCHRSRVDRNGHPAGPHPRDRAGD